MELGDDFNEGSSKGTGGLGVEVGDVVPLRQAVPVVPYLGQHDADTRGPVPRGEVGFVALHAKDVARLVLLGVAEGEPVALTGGDATL